MIEIETLLQQQDEKYNLEAFNLPEPNRDNIAVINHDLLEQTNFDAAEQNAMFRERFQMFNRDQRLVFTDIKKSLDQKQGKIFFLQADGGCGKTFVFNTLLNYARSKKKVALATAASGIAAQLLTKGTTVHHRFKVPLNIHDETNLTISKHHAKAEVLKKADLIVWDEAPMQNKNIMDYVDRLLRDLKSKPNKPFGGATVVFGGDFKQCLPVVLHGKKVDILTASMLAWPLWSKVKILQLTENMRVKSHENGGDTAAIDFIKFLKSIGNFTHDCVPNMPMGTVRLPKNITSSAKSLKELISNVFPDLEKRDTLNCDDDNDYFKGRAILTCLNKHVDDINAEILKRVPGDSQTFTAVNTLLPEDNESAELIPDPTYLDNLSPNGLPPTNLEIKVGSILMCLQRGFYLWIFIIY